MIEGLLQPPTTTESTIFGTMAPFRSAALAALLLLLDQSSAFLSRSATTTTTTTTTINRQHGVLQRMSDNDSNNNNNNNDDDPTKVWYAGVADAIQNVLTNSPLNEGKKALVKSLAGNYDQAAIRAKLDTLIADKPVLMLSFRT